MYLLDTNVLSEIVRPASDARVTAALGNLRASDLFASVLSRYELATGPGCDKTQTLLGARLQQELLPVVASWLPVSAEIAERGGEIGAVSDAKATPRSAT